jgi:hypothetical protein
MKLWWRDDAKISKGRLVIHGDGAIACVWLRIGGFIGFTFPPSLFGPAHLLLRREHTCYLLSLTSSTARLVAGALQLSRP